MATLECPLRRGEARVDGFDVVGFAQHVAAGANPLQVVRNELREPLLIATLLCCEHGLIRRLHRLRRRLSQARRTEERCQQPNEYRQRALQHHCLPFIDSTRKVLDVIVQWPLRPR